MTAAKSRSELILTGRFRRDRHSGRGEALVLGGRPRAPKFLKGAALVRFREIVRAYPAGGLSAVDAVPLAIGCQMEQAVIEQQRLVSVNPCDDKARRSLTGLMAPYLGFLDRFGLTPERRPRVKIPPSPEPEDEFAKFLNRKGSISGFARKRDAYDEFLERGKKVKDGAS